MIETWIIPHLTVGTRGFETTVSLIEIVECIFHRLKTGCQWRELPTKEFFTEKVLQMQQKIEKRYSNFRTNESVTSSKNSIGPGSYSIATDRVSATSSGH